MASNQTLTREQVKNLRDMAKGYKYQLKMRPWPQRFFNSYRGWRSCGFTRRAALINAWIISRVTT